MGFCDPVTQRVIGVVIDGDRIRPIRFPLLGGDDAVFDPVVNDSRGHAVSLAGLANGEGTGGRLGSWDAVLAPYPADHF